MQSNPIVTVTDSTLNLLKAAEVFAKTAESQYLIRQKLAPENFAPMPVKQRGGIFIVMTTRTAHQLSNSNVMFAVRSLQISAVRKENIAPAPAIRREVVRMIDKQYSSLVSYKSAMSQAKLMYSKGIITAEEYEIIETKMCEKFGINSCSIFRDNEWINTLFRGNKSDTKEAK